MRVSVLCECTDIMCLNRFEAIVDQNMFVPDCSCGSSAKVVDAMYGCVVKSEIKDGQVSIIPTLYVVEMNNG